MADLKPDDIVVATAVIMDRDIHGAPFIHAVPGDIGVILEDDFEENPGFPVVSWGVAGEGGTCNSGTDTFRRYEGPIDWVVDKPDLGGKV